MADASGKQNLNNNTMCHITPTDKFYVIRCAYDSAKRSSKTVI